VLSPADVSAFDAQGCRRGIPGSHTWGVPRHEEFTETALANWPRVVDARARRLFHDSRYAPSQAHGGHRPAT
jgi:hypothetical protein